MRHESLALGNLRFLQSFLSVQGKTLDFLFKSGHIHLVVLSLESQVAKDFCSFILGEENEEKCKCGMIEERIFCRVTVFIGGFSYHLVGDAILRGKVSVVLLVLV